MATTAVIVAVTLSVVLGALLLAVIGIVTCMCHRHYRRFHSITTTRPQRRCVGCGMYEWISSQITGSGCATWMMTMPCWRFGLVLLCAITELCRMGRCRCTHVWG